MRAGAEMAALGNDGAIAEGNWRLVIKYRFVRNANLIAADQVPGSPNDRPRINVTALSQTRAEESQEKAAPGMQRPRTYAEQQLVCDAPRQPPQAIGAGKTRAGEGVRKCL